MVKPMIKYKDVKHYRKPKFQTYTAKSVCITTYTDTVEKDIKIYLDNGYNVVRAVNTTRHIHLYMEKYYE
jgi:hypothetical protein